jgi:peptidoglycan/LPS O-acetylase OafA/YrhL
MPGRLDNIQILRALAALFVVAFHAGSVWGPEAYIVTDGKPLLAALFGHSGVELFFVLSGFIIAHATRRDPPGLAAQAAYARRRLWRIYPMVFLVVAFGLLLRYAAHLPIDTGMVVTSFSLIPIAGHYPIVLWSLSHEMLFYLVFAVTFISPRLALPLVLVLGMASTLAYLLWPQAVSLNPLQTLASPYNLLFAMGVAVQRLHARGHLTVARALPLLLLGAAAYATTAFYDVVALETLPESFAKSQAMHHLTPFYGLAAAVLVAGALAVPPLTGGLARALTRLGDASFSIYLVHFFGIQFAARLLVTSGLTAPVPGFVALMAAGTLAGLALWWLAERPLLNRLRGPALAARPAAA